MTTSSLPSLPTRSGPARGVWLHMHNKNQQIEGLHCAESGFPLDHFSQYEHVQKGLKIGTFFLKIQ